VYAFSFLIIAVSFAVIIYSYQLKDAQSSEAFNSSDCGNVSIPQQQAEEQEDLIPCYCY